MPASARRVLVGMHAVVLFLLCFLPACGAGELRDATGKRLILDAVPERIISLCPSATETICDLGEGGRLVGVTVYCKLSGPGDKKERIGTIIQPDIEKILVLNPDLIFATVEGNKKGPVLTLRRLGIPVFVFGEVRSFKDIFYNTLMMGSILNKEKSAEELVGSMKARIKDIEERTGKVAAKRVFIQLGTRPLVTVNRRTILDEMIRIAGGENIAKDSVMRYPQFDIEEVLVGNPEVIVSVDMGTSDGNILERWYSYPEIEAVKKEKIYLIDSDLLCNQSPRLIEGLEELARVIHPEAIK